MDIQKFVDALSQTWPARMAQDTWSGIKAPGNAYQSTWDNPVTTEQMIKPAADLAGLMTLGATAAPAMRNATGMGIRAYHGSPHNFDRFDISKIGMGEGAQAYGRGLYFAENKSVAKQYRDQLSGGQKGHMYEVNINADPAHMIPWDENIARNPELVEKIRGLVPPEKMRGFDHSVRVGVSGQDVYQGILGAQVRHQAPAVNQSLVDAGIPGIKYLDQGSRVAGEGSRNYVVFNDKIIDILKKYGIIGAAVIPGAGIMSNTPPTPTQ